ncbi:hypothetical protein GLAREA_00079 [Glarea lozoyensis ATCC 20868]|uniref:Uncharacterized protein n=1 Tax=Glarea lozoyensis (strain ATCC 20868 / MF5171) TaxID=1116229 RepID=S3DAC4_GLAL2|nr:uncharacterized protein GLAREA_00079 [Glarea lozoyensis ATCC 20868]EPE28921.1 hypothetical protein GLAREA_00079 [Glarea lozoyensis ATCC 20868]
MSALCKRNDSSGGNVRVTIANHRESTTRNLPHWVNVSGAKDQESRIVSCLWHLPPQSGDRTVGFRRAQASWWLQHLQLPIIEPPDTRSLTGRTWHEMDAPAVAHRSEIQI